MRLNIPDAIPIIAVYLRVTETDQGIEFNAAECAIDDGRDGLPSLHSVEPVRHRRLRLWSPVGEPRPRTRLWLQAHTRGPKLTPVPICS